MIINPNNFLTPLEIFNPLSLDYLNFWKQEKRRIIEGYWVGNVWMPPELYFYINYWFIDIKQKLSNGRFAKNTSLGKPFLRDVEWEKFLINSQARGFSGFSEDTEFHCDYELIEIDPRKFILPYDYLRKNHKGNLGKALYNNPCRNIIDIEARGGGKTYISSVLIGHKFITDGINDYDLYINNPHLKFKSQAFVGAAIDAYSSNLATKVLQGIDSLEGAITFAGKSYPSPFSKYYAGSLKNGKFIISQEEVTINGKSETHGSGSIIYHRTFDTNPLAANGTRPEIVVLDEVGFMKNLREVLGSLVDCTTVGSKIGVIYLTGTGGDMKGKAAAEVQEVFYNPERYDCISFDDIYEHKGQIGFFLPRYKIVNEYKDEYFNTIEELGIRKEAEDYAKIVESKDSLKINQHLINRPSIPSHAFLIKEGNIFAVKELTSQLSRVETEADLKAISHNTGELEEDANGLISFTPKRLPLARFPVRSEDDNTGCVVIYEPPIVDCPPSLIYLAATDPVSQDKTKGSSSLTSTLIYKRCTINDTEGDILVAEYTGRAKSIKEGNEIIRKLCKYYNAINLYENQFQNLKEYFESKNCLHLLQRTPTWLKSTVTQSRAYGINMTKDIKDELELYLRDWLIEPNPKGGLNLHYIYSPYLLKELILYNDEENFDRVITLMILIAHKITVTKKNVVQKQNLVRDSFFDYKTKNYYR